jgi:hypothetical protein
MAEKSEIILTAHRAVVTDDPLFHNIALPLQPDHHPQPPLQHLPLSSGQRIRLVTNLKW